MLEPDFCTQIIPKEPRKLVFPPARKPRESIEHKSINIPNIDRLMFDRFPGLWRGGNCQLSRFFGYKRDLKRFQHNKEVKKAFNDVLKLLLQEKKLPEKNKDHPLKGNYSGYRECHIKPDVLLVYRVDSDGKVLYLARIGSHSELF